MMDIFAQYLEDRQKSARDQAEADQRWLEERGGIDPAKRLIEWEKWLRNQLRSRLKWPEDKTKREKLIGQCMAEITKMVRQIHGRGWLLDGKALSTLINALLGPIALAQRDGRVRRFWPYFRRSVADFVGQHAEEIQFNARQTGGDLGFTTLGSAIAGLGITGQKSAKMTELIVENAKEVQSAKSLRERQRELRKQQRCKTDAQQGQLL